MTRIRTIKPEFWSSPSHRYADPWVRLFFQSMWNWADDTGRGTANPRELAAFAFPDDEDPTVPTVDDIPRLLLEVQKRYDVVFYKVDGRRYYEIPSWNKHQRNERKAASRHPGPEQGAPYDPGPGDGVSFTESRKFRDTSTEGSSRGHEGRSGGPRQQTLPGASMQSFDDLAGDDYYGSDQQEQDDDAHHHGTSVMVVGSSVAGTGEQGNRGTGEQDCRAASADGTSNDRDASGVAASKSQTPNQRAKVLADVYCKLVPLTDFMGVRGIVRKAIDTEMYSDAQIEKGLKKVAKDKWPLKANTLRIAIEGVARSQADTADIIEAGRDLVDRYEAQEAEDASSYAAVHQLRRGVS